SRKRRSLKLAAGISVASIIIVTLIVFFAVSFSFEDIFAKSWLILLAGFSVALFVALLFFSIILSGKIKKLLIRLTVAVPITLFITLIALFGYVVIDPSLKWYICFVILPIPLLLGDTIVSFIINNKLKWVKLLALVVLFFTLLYVSLCLLDLTPWHPSWLLILVGVLVDIIIAFIVIRVKSGKYSTHKDDHLVDEKYYSEWKE
ncbi:MAG: hypothetical protein WAO23_06660, partial [Dethiobacteria bacterium]